MRIESIEVYRVSMPLVYPFRTAFGNDEAIESVLVRMVAGGTEGWGEAAPWRNPAYSPESAAGAFLTIRDFLAPRLLGETVECGQDLQARLACVKGNHFAKAALDLAWWDCRARAEETPLWKRIGGVEPEVEVGADFGVMESVDLLLGEIEAAFAAGHKRVKLKYRPGWDLTMLRAVRERFPDGVFHVDCNSAYTLADTKMLRALDDFGLSMIEQPLMHDDLVDHAALQKRLRTPICLDESVTSPDRARKAIGIGACGWVNIKPGRVGGITPALAIHDICQDAGVPCWIGGMLESSVGAHHCLALATLPNIRYPSDLFPTSRFYREDLSEPPMEFSGPGRMRAPGLPGCGARPSAARLAEETLDRAELRPA
jgi:o-succinylbenzoate synthase